jgi:hypothetical protein
MKPIGPVELTYTIILKSLKRTNKYGVVLFFSTSAYKFNIMELLIAQWPIIIIFSVSRHSGNLGEMTL